MRRIARMFAAMASFAMLGACAGYYPAAGYPTTQQGTVRCESEDGRSRHCPADVRGGVRLSHQLSRTDCVQGRNWSYDTSGIWVSGGCRADFAVW